MISVSAQLQAQASCGIYTMHNNKNTHVVCLQKRSTIKQKQIPIRTHAICVDAVCNRIRHWVQAASMQMKWARIGL